MSWNDMIYEYDGTYEGFLCCIFDSYVNKEFPIAFVSNEEFPVLSLYSVRTVETNLNHSDRHSAQPIVPFRQGCASALQSFLYLHG